MAVALLAGCAVAGPARAHHVPPAPIRFAAVGDSITVGTCQAPQLPASGALQPCSWPGVLAADARFSYAGGWARNGATTTQMAQSFPRVGADVLVVAGGTNDFAAGIDWPSHRADIEAIVAKAPGARVLILGIPPLDSLAADGAVTDRNARLAAFARDRHWDFLNPWTPYATPDYRWLPGDAADGAHPIGSVAQGAGTTIGEHLLSVAQR